MAGRSQGRGPGPVSAQIGRRAFPTVPAPPPRNRGAPWRWAFVPASLARTPSFFFQAAGRRCGRTPATRSLTPCLSRHTAFPCAGGPRGAGLPQATAEPVPGGGLEPFQAGDGFSLLDFEMTIYHHN